MSVQHPKLHIVLTAKARHAEFKCPLCKKLFISAFHLTRHKSRRHSQVCENVNGQDQAVQYRNALEERIRNRQAVNASHRMEKLLRNLNLEETHLLDKSKKLNSSSFTDVSYGADQFPCISVLSPITSRTNILRDPAVNKINISPSSKTKCKENDISKFRSNACTWVTSKDLGLGDFKRVGNFNAKASQTDFSFLESKLLNDNKHHDLEFATNMVEKATQTDETDVRFISRLENLFTDKVDSMNWQSSISEFVLNNDVQTECKMTNANVLTQTDESFYRKSCSYTQTCRSLDICEEFSSSTRKSRNLRKHVIGLAENSQNINENKKVEKYNTENIAPVFEQSVTIAFSSDLRANNGNEIELILNKDYLTFEREFQESFKARKNLLEKDDFMLYNGTVNSKSLVEIESKNDVEMERVSGSKSSFDVQDSLEAKRNLLCKHNLMDSCNPPENRSKTSFDEKFESDFQDSFETKRNLLSKTNVMDLCNSPENGSDGKRPSESIENSDNPITKISLSSNSSTGGTFINDQIQPDVKINQEEHGRISDKRHEDILQHIKDELAARLRNLGVDPEWSGISDIIAKKTDAVLTVRRINISKKIPRFIPLRTMLNNTIDQILESKECE